MPLKWTLTHNHSGRFMLCLFHHNFLKWKKRTHTSMVLWPSDTKRLHASPTPTDHQMDRVKEKRQRRFPPPLAQKIHVFQEHCGFSQAPNTSCLQRFIPAVMKLRVCAYRERERYGFNLFMLSVSERSRVAAVWCWRHSARPLPKPSFSSVTRNQG